MNYGPSFGTENELNGHYRYLGEVHKIVTQLFLSFLLEFLCGRKNVRAPNKTLKCCYKGLQFYQETAWSI